MSKLDTKQEFIAFFESIPEERWLTGTCGETERPDGRCCAGGHCLAFEYNRAESNGVSWSGSPTRKRLQALLDPLDTLIQEINDGLNPRYKQETPKQRILAALRDLPDSDA